MNIRLSRSTDYFDIEFLVMKSFGVRDDIVSEGLEGRYFVFVDNSDRVIGMSGLESSNLFEGLKISRSCVLPEYRNRGIMSELISAVVRESDIRGCEKLYCSALRLYYKEVANLHYILMKNGFSLIESAKICWRVGKNCDCDKSTCVNYTGVNCLCYEDLYRRDKNT